MTWSLTDPDFLRDPAPQLAAMRAEGAVVRTRIPLFGAVWVTTTDAAARTLLKDTDRFVREPRKVTGKSMARTFWFLPRAMAPLLRNLVQRDDPDHARLRALVDQAFARSAVDDLKPRIAALADRLLDRVPADRPVDLVAGYSRELPFLVICELLGIPEDQRPVYARGMKPISAAASAPRALWAMLRLRPLIRHLQSDIAEVRRTGRPGLMGELVRVEAEDGGRLDDEELLAMVFTLFVAGHETTVHLINNAILALIDAPEIRRRLVGSPAELPLAVEEFMRFFSPVLMTKAHFVAVDTELHGVALRKGEKITALLLAANHDPERWEAPDRLIPDRRPNAHLGFGFGPHVCLGMQLARAEAAIAVERLFKRFPDLALDGPRPAPLRRIGIRAPSGLRVRLRR